MTFFGKFATAALSVPDNPSQLSMYETFESCAPCKAVHLGWGDLGKTTTVCISNFKILSATYRINGFPFIGNNNLSIGAVRFEAPAPHISINGEIILEIRCPLSYFYKSGLIKRLASRCFPNISIFTSRSFVTHSRGTKANATDFLEW